MQFHCCQSHDTTLEKLNSTALLSKSRGNLSSFELSNVASQSSRFSLPVYHHQILTETRCNIGNAPDSVSTESKADQPSDLVRHEVSPRTSTSSLSCSRMLFPAINLSSRLSSHKRSNSKLTLIASASNLSVRYALIARLVPSPANFKGRFTTTILCQNFEG